MKRGQISVEFAVLMVFMMFMLGGLIVAIQGRMVFLHEAQDLKSMSELGNLISNEVQLAAKVGDGYTRDFSLPAFIKGNDYNATIQGNLDLVINYNGLQHVTFLDVPVIGTLGKGTNTILNSGGNLFLV